MQEATTLKRVKPEPSDGTPANKRLKPDELERVRDKKDKLISRLYQKSLEDLMAQVIIG